MPDSDATPDETPTIGGPIRLDLTIDLDKALRGRGPSYDYDGEPADNGGPMTVEDLVLDAVVAGLVANVAADREWYQGERSRISNIRDGIIADLLTPILTEAVNKSVQPTNKLGESACDPVTLSDIIVQRAQAWLGETKGGDGFGRSGKTRLQSLIDEAVGREFQTALVSAVAAGKAEILAAVQASAADVLAKTIAQMAAKG